MTAHRLHRQLLARLLHGGLAIVALLGGGVLWWDVERLEAAIVAMGIEEARLLAPKLPADLNGLDDIRRDDLDARLEAVMADRARLPDGHFVVAELYDLARRPVADAVAADGAAAESIMDLDRHHFPAPGTTWYDEHLIAGQVYLQVVAPLWSQDGTQSGWFEGVFLIPRHRLMIVAWTGLRASLLVVIAVIATTALLYPLLASLNARLIARSRALLHANLGTLELLGGAIAKRDSDTNAHNYRVTLYAVRLAEAVGLPPDRIRALIKGAFLHDVGKIAIPDRILLKPGKLDDAEMAVMRTHVAHGLDIVRRFDWLRDAADVVGGHHEQVDGSGYPAGLQGDTIPEIARIFAIADVFDALTSRRPYKEPFPLERTLSIMAEGKGRHFDASLLEAFTTLAPALHEHLGGREDDGVQQELHAVTDIYFARTISG